MNCRFCGSAMLPCPSCGKTPDDLSRAELEVLRLFCSGDYTVEEAASTRGCSPNTVRTHLRSIYRKLDVRSQSGMVVEGFRTGLASGP